MVADVHMRGTEGAKGEVAKPLIFNSNREVLLRPGALSLCVMCWLDRSFRLLCIRQFSQA